MSDIHTIFIDYYGYNYGVRDFVNRCLSDQSILYLSLTCKELYERLADVRQERGIRWGFKCHCCGLPVLNFYEGCVGKFDLFKKIDDNSADMLDDIELDTVQCFYYNVNMGIGEFRVTCSSLKCRYLKRLETEMFSGEMGMRSEVEYMRYLIEHVMFSPPKQNVRQKFLRWSYSSNSRITLFHEQSQSPSPCNDEYDCWGVFKAWVYYMLEARLKEVGVPIRLWANEDFPEGMLEGLIRGVDFMYEDVRAFLTQQ